MHQLSPQHRPPGLPALRPARRLGPIGLMVVPAQLTTRPTPPSPPAASRTAAGCCVWALPANSFHQAVQAYGCWCSTTSSSPSAQSLARQAAVLGLVSIPITFLNVLNEVAALTLVSGAGFLVLVQQAAARCRRAVLHASARRRAAGGRCLLGPVAVPACDAAVAPGRVRKLAAALVAGGRWRLCGGRHHGARAAAVRAAAARLAAAHDHGAMAVIVWVCRLQLAAAERPLSHCRIPATASVVFPALQAGDDEGAHAAPGRAPPAVSRAPSARWCWRVQPVSRSAQSPAFRPGTQPTCQSQRRSVVDAPRSSC